ncbi:GerA spore germination protein [Alkaliphilus metalliredigens QYMF]|uniref:GerA spore germination protein n=1 Tax=Alkaliphilus metalliredigens (strain QYMF) TaxID=293826 RepID=A6TT22_ALKMQ|nr:spore germination protein [Alkaliphilus metalliredigens]ABR49340.1 GerA spore germination protein [Alkaliphilus metalliredigens QYMF]
MRKSTLQIIKESIHKITKNNSKTGTSTNKDTKSHETTQSVKFSHHLDKNIQIIESYLGDSDDIKFRYLQIPTLPSIRAVVVFIETLVDDSILESSVLTPLTQGLGERTVEERTYLSSHIDDLIESTLPNSNICFLQDVNEAVDELLSGNGIILIQNYANVISITISQGAAREYAEPQTEKVVKGPQQGFVEDIAANVSMIRKRIKSPNLVIKELTIGRESRSEIRVAYIKHIVNPSIVKEVFKRLKRIDVDGIVGSASIEEYIDDAPTNLFQTTFYTERPDRVQAMLLEGRITILCDGTPFAITVPAIVTDFFINSDDYYQNPYFASFTRFIGYLGAFMMTFLPSIYIAVSTFHQEVLPTSLALTIAGARAGVPFPTFVETLIMEIAFEALRQAGTRLPTHVGQAVSIVGALIIGQAAVEAGLVSSAVVIVVATTAIFSFTIPYTNFSLSLRLTRFFMMALAATLGIYGIMTGALLVALNLVSLRSFGVPFMVPFAPLSFQDMKDWVFRFPQWAITKRSPYIVNGNVNKKAKNLKPKP